MKGPDETDGRFLRVEFTAHPSRKTPGSASDLAHSPWAVDLTDEHVHPRYEESFEVLAGEWNVSIEGQPPWLTQRDEITIPRGVSHREWNPSDQPARLQLEARPALQLDTILETAYPLAQAGKADESGLPNILHMAVTLDAYPGHFYPTTVPVGVQKALLQILTPIGPLLGYKASYSRDEIDRPR